MKEPKELFTLYVDRQTLRDLRAFSGRTGVSFSNVMRDAVEAFVELAKDVDSYDVYATRVRKVVHGVLGE